MLLLVDCCLNDGGMVGVWDQTDDQCVLSNLGLESSGVVYIEGDWYGVGQTVGELLCGFEGTAGLTRVLAGAHTHSIRGADEYSPTVT